jgi:hypothetical protein
MEKYIVSYGERSEGSQCNGDHVYLIESDTIPTVDSLRAQHYFLDGPCTNVSGAGCENCGGSHIENFKTEKYSLDRAIELGLEKKL